MNERIKELAEQAGLRTELWNNPEPFLIYKEDVHNPGGLEKFAELIVRECADYIQHFYGDIAASSIGNDIKLHFGIEE